MKEGKHVTLDPVCGSTVDEATALHSFGVGRKYYFCGTRCLQIFLSKSDAPGGMPEYRHHDA